MDVKAELTKRHIDFDGLVLKSQLIALLESALDRQDMEEQKMIADNRKRIRNRQLRYAQMTLSADELQ